MKDNIFCHLIKCYFYKRSKHDINHEEFNNEGLTKRNGAYHCDIIWDETCIYLDTNGKIIDCLGHYKSPILALSALVKFNEKNNEK